MTDVLTYGYPQYQIGTVMKRSANHKVETLIKAGADVNVMSADKLMPIHLAISTTQAASMSPTAPNGIPWSVKGALMCVQHLANSGADLDYVCPFGFSGMDFLKRIGAV